MINEFVKVKVGWSNSTFLFYLAIVLISYILAIIASQLKGKGKYGRIGCKLILTLIYTTLFIVKAFSTTGRDLRTGYYINFLSATSWNEYADKTVEPGFRLLMILARNISNSYATMLILVAFITLFPVCYLTCKYISDIDIPSSVLMYTSLFYIQSFSPLRNYLAVSISLFFFYWLAKKKYLKSILFIFFGMLFHTSVMFLFAIFIFMLLKRINKRQIVLFSTGIFILAIVLKNIISALFTGRYAIYSYSDSIQIGFQQFIYYIPLFAIYFISEKNVNTSIKALGTNDCNYISKLCFSYITIGFLFGLLGYVISIFGRTQALFLPLVFIIPYCINKIKKKNRIAYYTICICVLVYSCFRFYIYLSEYCELEYIMPYSTWTGLVI